MQAVAPQEPFTQLKPQQSVDAAQGAPAAAHCWMLEVQVLDVASHSPEQQSWLVLQCAPTATQLATAMTRPGVATVEVEDDEEEVVVEPGEPNVWPLATLLPPPDAAPVCPPSLVFAEASMLLLLPSAPPPSEEPASLVAASNSRPDEPE